MSTACVPRRRRMHVDFDDAGVGRDLDDVDARVERRRIAFEADGLLCLGGCRLDGGDQGGIVLPIAEAAAGTRTHGRRAPRRRAPCARVRALVPELDARRPASARPPARQAILRCGKRIGGEDVGVVLEGDLRQARQRQAQAKGRVAGNQEQVPALEGPPLRDEAAFAAGLARQQQRQHVADRLVQAAIEGADQAFALRRLGQLLSVGATPSGSFCSSSAKWAASS